jgi:hypothetical protein
MTGIAAAIAAPTAAGAVSASAGRPGSHRRRLDLAPVSRREA